MFLEPAFQVCVEESIIRILAFKGPSLGEFLNVRNESPILGPNFDGAFGAVLLNQLVGRWLFELGLRVAMLAENTQPILGIEVGDQLHNVRKGCFERRQKGVLYIDHD
jgi:hypothetical protein